MASIKLILTDNGDGCYECGGSNIVINSITDWEEVSREDIEFLKKYKYDLQQLMGLTYHQTLLILEKDALPATSRVAELKAKVADKLAKAEAARIKRSESAKAGKQKRLEALRAKELETLNKLKEKYGS